MRIGIAAALIALVGCTNEASDVEDTWVLSPTDPESTATTSGAVDVSDRVEAMSRPRDHDRPTGLAFNPEVENELWVVNKRNDSATIIDGAGTADQDAEVIIDPYALHFMEEVTSIAFGAPGTFATCQDGTNTYNGQAQGNNFTGPALWSSARSIFGISNPAAVEFLTDRFGSPVDLGSHLDMLHESPECMGIAWDHDNVYWVFDGFNGHIVRYDFAEDHGPGYDDHSDGVVSRHMSTDVSRVPGVSSHLVMDHDTGLLYVADTGNSRIMVLDTNTGRRGDDLSTFDCWSDDPQQPPSCVDHHEWRRSDWTTLIDGTLIDMEWPSGIDLHDGTLFVTDAKSNEILAFELTGELVGRAYTGLDREKALGAITVRSMDELWYVDARGDQVYRLQSPVAAPVQ